MNQPPVDGYSGDNEGKPIAALTCDAPIGARWEDLRDHWQLALSSASSGDPLFQKMSVHSMNPWIAGELRVNCARRITHVAPLVEFAFPANHPNVVKTPVRDPSSMPSHTWSCEFPSQVQCKFALRRSNETADES